MLVSVYSFSYGLGTPVLAALVARWRRPNVVFYTLCGFALVNLGCAFAPSYGVLIVLKALAGLCAAIYTPTAYLLAASMASEKRRGSALAAVAIGLTVASVLGIPIGTWIGYHFGWHVTFVAIALTTVDRRRRDPSRPDRRPEHRHLGDAGPRAAHRAFGPA